MTRQQAEAAVKRLVKQRAGPSIGGRRPDPVAPRAWSRDGDARGRRRAARGGQAARLVGQPGRRSRGSARGHDRSADDGRRRSGSRPRLRSRPQRRRPPPRRQQPRSRRRRRPQPRRPRRRRRPRRGSGSGEEEGPAKKAAGEEAGGEAAADRSDDQRPPGQATHRAEWRPVDASTPSSSGGDSSAAGPTPRPPWPADGCWSTARWPTRRPAWWRPVTRC